MTEEELKKANFIDGEIQKRFYDNGEKFTVEDVEYVYDVAFTEGRKETFSEAVIKNLKENTSVMTAIIMGKLSEKCERLEKQIEKINAIVWKSNHRFSDFEEIKNILMEG